MEKPGSKKVTKRIRVLLVDDDESFASVSKRILEMENDFEIDTALTVDKALEKLNNYDYDVIVSDYEMPHDNGIDFLKEVNNRGCGVPFILFTGKGREEVAMQAINLGADGYYNKHGSTETVYGELAHGIRMAVQRYQAQKQVKSNEEQLNTFATYAPIGMARTDADERFTNANPAFCQMLGYSEIQLQEMTIKDIIREEDLEEYAINMNELASNKVQFFSGEAHLVGKDRKQITGKFSITALRDGDGKPALFIGQVEDISEQRKAATELEQKYTLLESVGENIDAGLVIIDRNYRIVWANKKLKNVGACFGETCYQTIAHSGHPCLDCGVRKVFEQNLPLHVHEYKTANAKGETVWVELRATPLRNGEGEVVAALELAVGITERKRYEQRLVEDEYMLSLMNEKLRVVGSLTRHDARNKLSAINGYTYILKKKCADRPEVIDGLNKIEQSVRETEWIFNHAKTYEELGVQELNYVDAEKAADEACKLFRGTIPKVQNELHGLTVLADSFLKQFFHNLIDNTIRHGEKATEVRFSYEQNRDDQIRLVYEDNGVGVPAHNKPALFTKGFSTGGGTGFGLFLSKKMIDVYGWTIQETGEPGKGVRFVITIPRGSRDGQPNYKIQSSEIVTKDEPQIVVTTKLSAVSRTGATIKTN